MTFDKNITTVSSAGTHIAEAFHSATLKKQFDRFGQPAARGIGSACKSVEILTSGSASGIHYIICINIFTASCHEKALHSALDAHKSTRRSVLDAHESTRHSALDTESPKVNPTLDCPRNAAEKTVNHQSLCNIHCNEQYSSPQNRLEYTALLFTQNRKAERSISVEATSKKCKPTPTGTFYTFNNFSNLCNFIYLFNLIKNF